MIKCPLCGNTFDEEKAKGGCIGCGVKGCGLTRCPNCGCEFPPEKKPKKEGFLKKIFNKE